MHRNVVVAREAARRLVEPLGRRWLHVQACVNVAEHVAQHAGLDVDLLVSAMWLHDVGYSPELVDTGFHPVDGARYLRDQGWDELVVRLVAHHSFARFEAQLRDLTDKLKEFPRPPTEYEDAVCFCDMTTGPAGDQVGPVERLDEVKARYGPEHPTARWADVARPEILAAVARVETRLGLSGSQASAR